MLRRAHRSGFAVQSNFARRHAEIVALAASKGLVTTKVGKNRFGRDWLITVLGLQWLNTTEVSND